MFKNPPPNDRATRLHRHEQPLLPSLAGSFAKRSVTGPTRWTKLLVGVVGVYWVWSLSRGAVPREVARTVKSAVRGDSCEASGLVSPATPGEDQHRVVVRVRPIAADAPPHRNPDNTILSTPFHPTLSTQHHPLFDGVASSLPVALDHPKQCITPSVHSLPILPKSNPSSSLEPSSHAGARSPELFFSVCTTPERAVKYSPVWRHFMSAPDVDPAIASSSSRVKPAATTAPGCVVTDAQGEGDGKGLSLANAEFRRRGLSCTMRDSSRAGERYEMRVLGLIRDAWVESERRRWQDGAPLVEWYIFGDDDTWFSDSEMLREMLAGYDWREDFFLGAHSETVGNFQTFGKIGFGGAGLILSRSLVRKMQPHVDDCASRFAHMFGGDGIVSHCAAWVRGIPLEQLVEEIPALRQMDVRGDATGYLTAGSAPFLSLHHWAGWLDLIPGVDGIDAIKLLGQASSAVGGPNFLRRWLFDGGLVVFTVGHSITFHREALSPEDLSRIEWTWEAHEPRRPSRRGLREFDDKLTYYLSSVERLSPDVTLLRHTCAHPSVQAGLREIDVLWDVRKDEPSWRERWLPSWTSPAPSPRAGRATAHGRAKKHVRRDEQDLSANDAGEAEKEQEAQPKKRPVRFSA
ncbi:glycosyltransferase family 31 protein [Rhodotorula graminis WP1]|uniref:Glycosyltransferase family 31 protein n=1 Tax=Rhodotorula graminis (strain WP1) TaxID=578459 RepID=A0A194S647_RHOGW|nr:glycosyltransferase family 31 protein [Rhodotorula graminis WP1]KPV76019.1 glycosyltransferase family 31 protein [Rhodotorula graminis WP1]